MNIRGEEEFVRTLVRTAGDRYQSSVVKAKRDLQLRKEKYNKYRFRAVILFVLAAGSLIVTLFKLRFVGLSSRREKDRPVSIDRTVSILGAGHN